MTMAGFEIPLLDALEAAWVRLHSALFEQVFLPVLYGVGWGHLLGEGYTAALWLMAGLCQLLVMVLVLRPLERWRPVEATQDSKAVRVDVFYTLIHRLGFFRVLLFFALEPLWATVSGQLSLWGVGSWHLDAAISSAWPALAAYPWVAFLAYLVVFDLVDYLLHRAQHHFPWWWALHAVHHSQQHMNLWSDNRNHFLDDVLRDLVFVLVFKAIGVAPAQFVALVVLAQLWESLAHANLRLGFSGLWARLLVSPAYHRVHHLAGLGHESAGEGSLGGRNYAVLFPIWDVLFRTADWRCLEGPTGIRDQWPSPGRPARHYGRGLWQQQWLGLKRLWGRG
jgi:sterol desaturase/sphingolipid hydroxylase (fatty acid hydroxylase superfamily)